MGYKRDIFFDKMTFLDLALTYDDVTLRTGHSKVLPKDVKLDTWFSRNVPLKIPIVSAAMDTVTESAMAIAMAKLGGLGIIHKNMSVERQAAEVAMVKYHLNGLIRRPIVARSGETVEQVLSRREIKGYSFHSYPVVDASDKLVGLVTKNDFDFCEDVGALVDTIMTPRDKLVTAPEGTGLDAAFELMHRHKKKVILLLSEDGTIAGCYLHSDLTRIRSGESSAYNVDSNNQLIVGAALGVSGTLERAEALVQSGVDVAVLDTAHADSENYLRSLREVKDAFPKLDVVAGNISDPESVDPLLQAGADGEKVGQGPGSICTTRVVAGVGMPQVTAVHECTKELRKEEGGYIVPACADGGIRYPGDVSKAIAAGAHSVMLGSMLAGTDQAPGDVVTHRGRQVKVYRGMGSLEAMQEGSQDRYCQEGVAQDKLVPEGVKGFVPYRGDVAKIVFQMIGGLRQGMGYVGAADIEELRTKANFKRVTPVGRAESHPHDLESFEDAPNYKARS